MTPSPPSQSSRYSVRIVPRELYMTNDDWHATVTRKSDGATLIFICDWLWLLRYQCSRRQLDRSFRSLDRRRAKLARVSEFSR